VIARLAVGGEMAILLVEQYLDFAREVADDRLVMDRGRSWSPAPTATWTKTRFGGI
jgi:ABC-type branched-subunit amino acid transport system ATPase component